MILAVLLAGCVPDEGGTPADSIPPVDTGAPPPDPSGDTGTPAPSPEMSAMRLASRLSLDLRGVRPTEEELLAVEADPAALEGLVEAWLADERFPERLVDLYADLYQTVAETYAITGDDVGLDDEDFERSIGEEPLRLLATIAAEDRPYYEIVTADWTVIDEQLAAVYPTDYPDGATGWQKAHYTDGRPAAGILSTNGLWWRFGSTESNANRKRANALSRILTCNDYLSRPIEFDRNVNLLDGGAVADALLENPGCVACHVSLDPIAGYLFGFWYYVPDSPADAAYYHPEREALWKGYTGAQPAWYGEPGYSMSDLTWQVASDPRLVECATEQVFELYVGRQATLADQDRLTAYREAFLDGGLTLKALVRSVVTDPDYRAGDTDREGAMPTKLASPALLASQVEGLTGFRWTFRGGDMLATDEEGVRTLAGGADGAYVLVPAGLPTATSLLVQETLAQLAAAYAAEREAGLPPAERTLFREVDFTETPTDRGEALAAQVQALHLRVLGQRVAADGPEVTELVELWETVFALDGDQVHAWTAVLTVLLRDPDLVLY